MKNKFLKFFGLRKYEGAAVTKRTSGWRVNSANADSTIKASLTVLRNRARDLVRNNPHASRGVDVLVNNIVGKGIIGVVKHPNPDVALKLNTEFRKWADSKQCDFEGRHDLAGLQRLVVRSAIESGECLVRRLYKKSNFPLEFQILEGDYLDVTDTFKTSDEGRSVFQGIIFQNGKRVGYRIFETHPGSYDFVNGLNKIDVSADEIAHVYRVDRPGQNRGIPALSNVMIRLKDLDEYEDAHLVRQKIAACFSVFIYDTDASAISDEEIEMVTKLEPGAIEILPPGKDIKLANPPGVEGYKDYMSVNLHSIAAGLGISYEALTNDLSQVNFSSGRMGWLEMSRTIDSWRFHVLKPCFLDFVAAQWLKAAFFKFGDVANEASIVWTMPKREMIDPTKEIPATVEAIRGGLLSLSDAVKQSGKNPDDHFAELAEDNTKLDSLKLILDSDARYTTKAGNKYNKDETTNGVDNNA